MTQPKTEVLPKILASDSNEVDPIDRVRSAFNHLGNEKYGDENVTQLQHALQSACLAIQENAPTTQIVAALLHDLGHILRGSRLPTSCDEDLDDQHEEVAYPWLLQHFGERVAEPVRLHVSAKRYLCTTVRTYKDGLSPTSLKSLKDQGGLMNDEELDAFRRHPFYFQAIQLRRWDDVAKDARMETPSFEYFVKHLQDCLTVKN